MRTRYIIALFLGTVAASPVAEPATTAAAAFCSIVTGLVTKAKAQSPATAYCSSFLGIKTATVKTTVPSTSTVIVVQTVTTATSSAIVTESTTSTTTVISDPMCTPPQPALSPRAVAKPACLSGYTIATAISSACKCLSIPTPTSTVKVTVGVVTVTATTVSNVLASTASTTTVSSVATATVTNFVMRSSNNGAYANRFSIKPGFAYQVLFNVPPGAGITYGITETCGLRIDAQNIGGDGYICYGAVGQLVDCRQPGTAPASNYEPLVCSADGSQLLCGLPSTGTLTSYTCNRNGFGGAWILGTAAEAPQDCTAFTISRFVR